MTTLFTVGRQMRSSASLLRPMARVRCLSPARRSYGRLARGDTASDAGSPVGKPCLLLCQDQELLLQSLATCRRVFTTTVVTPADEVEAPLSGPMTTLVGAVHADGAEAVSTLDAAGKEIFEYNGPARPSRDWAAMRSLALKVWHRLRALCSADHFFSNGRHFETCAVHVLCARKCVHPLCQS